MRGGGADTFEIDGKVFHGRADAAMDDLVVFFFLFATRPSVLGSFSQSDTFVRHSILESAFSPMTYVRMQE